MTGLAEAEAVIAREMTGTEPRLEPDPRDELLILAGLFWGLATLLFLAWVWGWV